MKTRHVHQGSRPFGKRALTALLIAGACQVNGQLCCLRADDTPRTPTAAAQQKGWSHGVMLAEIAWLADPATFHERLTSVQVGDCLEIHGTVSNEANRNVAMTLAREASHMTTVDHMKIALAPALPSPGRSLDMIYRDAVHALYHTCPQLSRGLTVSTQDRGEVLVRGEVPTLEDKLAVSRALKAVAGCNCVKNQVRTRSGAETVTSATSKPKMQDNSLLVRLGLMQPRTEVVPSAALVARSITPREIPQPAAAKTQIATAPVVEPNRLMAASKVPVVPGLPPSNGASSHIIVEPVVPTMPAASGAASHAIVEPATPRPIEGQILLTSASSDVDTDMLGRAIALTCRLDLKFIRVVAGKGKTLTITITAADLEAGKEMAAKILAMPELVPYGVNLDVTLAH